MSRARTIGRRWVEAWAGCLATGCLVLLLSLAPAGAQTSPEANPIPPADIPDPGLGAPRAIDPLQPETLDPAFGLPSADPALPPSVAPYAAPGDDPAASVDVGVDPMPGLISPTVVLSAVLNEGGQPLRSGLVWRIFAVQAGPDGKLPLVAEAEGGIVEMKLSPGAYLAHCNFGQASSTTRIEVSGGVVSEELILNAGGLKLQALAEDRTLPDEDVRFDVLSQETDDQGEPKAVARNVAPGALVRLTAGTYDVVSRYGSVNAQTRAEVEVKAGKLSEVTLYQRAAEVTLKLVSSPGGEAIADTHWSILTPGGDVVTEGVGAFPSFILASGTYTVIAKHGQDLYQRDFEVKTGRDREVEVIASRSAAGQ